MQIERYFKVINKDFVDIQEEMLFQNNQSISEDIKKWIYTEGFSYNIIYINTPEKILKNKGNMLELKKEGWKQIHSNNDIKEGAAYLMKDIGVYIILEEYSL